MFFGVGNPERFSTVPANLSSNRAESGCFRQGLLVRGAVNLAASTLPARVSSTDVPMPVFSGPNTDS